MPVVEVSREIAAPVEKVWRIVNDVESYPRLIQHVRSVRTLESSTFHRLAEWKVMVMGSVVKWVELEAIDDAGYRIQYAPVKGSLGNFEAFWQLERLTDNSSRATVSISFDIGIPMFGEMLTAVCERAIRDNAVKMLRSVAGAAADGSNVGPA